MTAPLSRSRRFGLPLATLGVVSLGAVTLTIPFHRQRTLRNAYQRPADQSVRPHLATDRRSPLRAARLDHTRTGAKAVARRRPHRNNRSRYRLLDIPPELPASLVGRPLAAPLVPVFGERLEDRDGHLCRLDSRSPRNFAGDGRPRSRARHCSWFSAYSLVLLGPSPGASREASRLYSATSSASCCCSYRLSAILSVSLRASLIFSSSRSSPLQLNFLKVCAPEWRSISAAPLYSLPCLLAYS